MPAAVDVLHEPATHSTARNIRRTVLPNGLLVLTEQMPHMRSVAMGAWVASGSRDETAPHNGISHFVEHMVFKGTARRSAQDIAREVDSIGGNLDAFTGKESTCFSIRVLDSNSGAALDVLADLVLHPRFDQADLEREQGVILEEIKMDEDNPDYLVHETWTQRFWPGEALSRPILGTAETVSSFTPETCRAHHADRFSPRHMVFTAAGNLDHDRFVDEVERQFGGLAPAAGEPAPAPAAPRTAAEITLRDKPSLEQVQLCLGVPAPAVDSPDRFALYLLNSMLGGGMSSRLFESIRENEGLAYSVYSELSPFRDTGALAVYAGTSADRVERVIELTMREFRRLKDEGVPETELRRAKDLMRSNIVLGLESSGARMSNLARQQMFFGRSIPVEEIVASIEAVTPEKIEQLAHPLFRPEAIAVTLLGNLGSMTLERAALAC